MRELQEWLAHQLQIDATQLTLQPASKDASFRQYYRLRLDERSLIVMDASAELASCKPFVEIARLLAAAGLNVPTILAEDLARGWLLLSDLGLQTYLDILDERNADALFTPAIDALVQLQRIECPATLPRYDDALLRRELELFPEWYLQRHLGLTIDAELRAQLDVLFTLLIESALAQPQVLVHRDYMPRNLMLSEPSPGVLDFQDAVRGPISYDPICLFKDAFISWPEPLVEQWLRVYWQRARAAGLPVPEDFAWFYLHCDLMGAQRHLKVIGIFARINYRDGKPKYLQDVPRFFKYLRAVCERRPELESLALLLNRIPVQV
ncbi:MAG TPA: phosphotransferase [Spongiibacteraceae bacterium]|nr:phosphotransferase [Spongiibacteraceae bacterium]